MSISRHKLDKGPYSTRADLKRSTFNSSSVDQVSSGLLLQTLGSGLPVNLVPVVYQRLPYFVHSRLRVVILIRLITNYFLSRPPIARGERLIPTVEAEF